MYNYYENEESNCFYRRKRHVQVFPRLVSQVKYGLRDRKESQFDGKVALAVSQWTH